MNNSKATPDKRFYPEVESLRGIAAVAVMVFHVVGHRSLGIFGADGPPPTIFDPLTPDAVLSALVTTLFNGQAAVILFFTISGFVLAESLREDYEPTPGRYLGFLVRRLFRIVPLMWASLLFMATACAYYNATIPLGALINAMLLGDDINKYNAVLWSIRVELVMSAIFPLLYYVNRIGGRGFSLFLCGALIWLTRYPLPSEFTYILCFQLGIMLPDFGGPLVASIAPRWRHALAGVATILFLASFNLGRMGLLDVPGVHALKIVFSFLILSYAVYGSEKLTALLCAPVCRWLGKVSYGIYLFHSPMNFVASTILVAATPLAIREQTVLFGLMLLSITMPGTLLLSWAGYHWIERPFIVLGRTITSRRMLTTPAPVE